MIGVTISGILGGSTIAHIAGTAKVSFEDLNLSLPAGALHFIVLSLPCCLVGAKGP